MQRIVGAVSKQVVGDNVPVGSQCAVRINKPAGFRVVVAALQVVESGFGVVIIATIPEGVLVAHMVFVSDGVAASVHYL